MTRIEPVRGLAKLDLHGLWQARELLYFLTWRDLKVRFKQAALGVAWVLIQPIVTMLLFTVFFGVLIGVPSEGAPYPIFAYTAILPWQFLSNSVTRGTSSLVQSAGTITKVYFPRLLIPMSAVLSRAVEFAVSFIVLLGLMAYYGVAPQSKAWWLLAYICIAMLAALTASIWLGALNVLYRDIQVALPFLIQSWFFATPIVYPSSLVPEPWQGLYALNPMVGVVDGFRWSLLPEAPVPTMSTAIALVVLTVAFVSGLYYFRFAERSFADRI